MDSEIKGLLHKYWNAETTLEEEEMLRSWFYANQESEDFKEVGVLFQYFSDQQKKELTGVDQFAKETSILQKTLLYKSRRLFYKTMSIAAGIVMVFASVWFIREEVREDPSGFSGKEIVDTYDDPRKAFEETKKALLILSKSFGKAEQEARKLNLFNEAKDKIQKGKGQEEKNENEIGV